MYDINYFVVLKKQKQKSQNAMMIFFGFLVFLILVNAVVFGFAYMANRRLQTRINQNQAFITSPVTKAKVRDAAILDKELTIAKSYLEIVTKAADQIQQSSLIKVDLIDHIRALTPQTTYFESVVYKENTVKLNCMSTVATDPILYYNRLMHDTRFNSVYMSGINAESAGVVKFVIELTVKGGGQS